LPVVEELAHIGIHDYQCLMDFVLQAFDAACQAKQVALMLLLHYGCRETQAT
jgi:hypothetical protein